MRISTYLWTSWNYCCTLMETGESLPLKLLITRLSQCLICRIQDIKTSKWRRHAVMFKHQMASHFHLRDLQLQRCWTFHEMLHSVELGTRWSAKWYSRNPPASWYRLATVWERGRDTRNAEIWEHHMANGKRNRVKYMRVYEIWAAFRYTAAVWGWNQSTASFCIILLFLSK